MRIFDPYTWPLIGRRLIESRRREGMFYGFSLIRRGYPAEGLLRHANRCVSENAAAGHIGDMHECIGIAQAALRAKKEVEHGGL